MKHPPRYLLTATIVLALAAGASIFPRFANALDSDIFERLKSRPASLFDLGVKRIRAMAVNAADKLALGASAPPRVRVVHNPDGLGLLVVTFLYEDSGQSLPIKSAETCKAWLEKTVFETLRVGSGFYQGGIDVKLQIKRRLGYVFSAEFNATTEVRDQVGSEIADLLVFSLRTMDSKKDVVTLCKGTAAGTLMR